MLFDDFFSWEPDVTWQSTSSDANDSAAIEDGGHGSILVTTSKGDGAYYSFSTLKESFAFVSGKRAWMGVKITPNVIANSTELFIGLATYGTDYLSTSPVNWAGFWKKDDATVWTYGVTAAGVGLGTGTGTLTWTAGTARQLDMEFDGVDTFTFFEDGLVIGTVTSSSFQTTEMALACHVQSGSKMVYTHSIDYIYAGVER
jgi:hypothetical protein